MAQSSAHIGAVGTNSFLHNDRTQKVSYLIDDQSNNEISVNSTLAYQQFQELKLQAQNSYIKNVGQKPQEKTEYLKEVIVNLNQHHTMKDLDKVAELFEKEGYTILQKAIHKDEGHIETSDKQYIMGRTNYTPDTPNVAEFHDGKFYEMKFTLKEQKLKNGKTRNIKEWEKDKEIIEYEKKYNIHAHITYFTHDVETGKSIKAFGQGWQKSKLQTDVAELLKMQRGKVSSTAEAKRLNVEVQPKSKRKSTRDFRKNITESKVQTLAKLKDVQQQFKLEKERLKESGTAVQSDYKILKLEFDELKKLARSKDLSIQDLEDRLVDILVQPPEIRFRDREVEKIVKVEDFEKINKLELELEEIKSKANKLILGYREQIQELESKEPEIRTVEKFIDRPVDRIVKVPVDREVKVENTEKIDRLELELQEVKNKANRFIREYQDRIKELESREPEIRTIEVPVDRPVDRIVEVEDFKKINKLEKELQEIKDEANRLILGYRNKIKALESREPEVRNVEVKVEDFEKINRLNRELEEQKELVNSTNQKYLDAMKEAKSRIQKSVVKGAKALIELDEEKEKNQDLTTKYTKAYSALKDLRGLLPKEKQQEIKDFSDLVSQFKSLDQAKRPSTNPLLDEARARMKANPNTAQEAEENLRKMIAKDKSSRENQGRGGR